MKALNLAKYIVNKCTLDRLPVSNLQLQKILYYIQVYELKTYNKLAFEENIEAWQFGPVVPEVYYHFCGFGAMPIIACYNGSSNGIIHREEIDGIVEEKRVLRPWDLVADTHYENGPWYRIYDNGAGNHKIIPVDVIKEFAR